MSPFRFAIFVALVGFGYYQWRERHEAPTRPAESPGTSAFGFAHVPAFDSAVTSGVVIATTDDCPAAAMQRAQALAKELKDQGIPITWAQPVGLLTAGNDPVSARRLMAISSGEQPLVLVRGKAKANPSLADIVREYGRL
jgi:hypothetical protein